MQTGVLDRSLPAGTAYLHSSTGETVNDDSWQAIGIIHFDDDVFETDHSVGMYACKHGESLDEAG